MLETLVWLRHYMGWAGSAMKEIWNHDPYRRFRKKLLLGRKEIDICSNCSEGTKVWA